MQKKVFGKLPRGSRQQRIEESPNYRKGSFQNLAETPMMIEGVSYFSLLREFFKDKPERYPQHTIPTIKTDLVKWSTNSPSIIWFGHSSYLIYLEGKRILVDPVFSDRPSPVQYLGTKSFAGARAYSASDFPDVDLLILTHDHYDHLDYTSIQQLKSKIKSVCAPLGVAEHLVYWGIEEQIITEFDWWESAEVLTGIQLTATPARHFSGRGFTRNKSLWTSYVLKTSSHSIFIGGDSGYDAVFKTIGEKHGPFDLAILECGQYDRQWPYIHMKPEETVQASVDLNAKVLMPVHWGKFVLSNHAWKDPIERAKKHAELLQVQLATPRIGEPIILSTELPSMEWWNLIR